MSKKHIIFVLGADRVGKSTFVSNLRDRIIEAQLGLVETFHFAGPEPHHNSPIDQYKLPIYTRLLQLDPKGPDQFYICDRGGAEVCFYEEYRRHIDIDESWAQSFESWANSTFSSFTTVFIEKHFDEIKLRHHREIDQLHPNSSLYWRLSQLRSRENEHDAYYDYMYDYLRNQSLCPHIIYLDDNTDLEVQRITNLFKG